jgi:hypothetical protein
MENSDSMLRMFLNLNPPVKLIMHKLIPISIKKTALLFAKFIIQRVKDNNSFLIVFLVK